MRKLVIAILVAMMCFGEAAAAVQADGAIFPGDLNTGYLVVRYHHVDVTIDGPHAVTRVEQEFYNPYGMPVAGRYLFPVPPGAILSRFQVRVDGREQAAARQDAATTNAALRRLVTERRDPRLLQYLDWETLTFSMDVAPGAARRMTLEYEEVLAPAGGLYRYRYILSTENYASRPLEDVSLTVNLHAAGGLAAVYSATHPVVIEQPDAEHARVRWQTKDLRQPAEDFELYFAPASGGFGAGLLTGRRAGQDHFLFLFSPQSELNSDLYLPKDVVFIMDRSGSMQGDKLGQAQNALGYFLGRLDPADRFAIVSFNDRPTAFDDRLHVPEAPTLARAQRYVESLWADGSTDIDAALAAGLGILDRSERRQGATRMIVFLTDGLPTAGIMDGEQIAARAHDSNGELGARLHVFGVGYDVNTHLLDRLAADNGGSVTYVQPGENLEASLTAFYDRVAHPLLTDVQVEFAGMAVHDPYPQTIPDLFAGSSLLLTGAYLSGGPKVTVTVHGQMGEQARAYSYTFDLAQAGSHDFVPRLWATRRAGDLLDRVRVQGENPELVEQIRQLGLGYGLITPYTDFVIAAQTEGAASAANMQLYRQSGALNQASGQVTIQARVQNQAYQQANQAGLASGANILNNRQYSIAQVAAGQPGELNVDLSVLQRAPAPTEPVALDWVQKNGGIDRTVDFGSDEYFKLAADPEARPALQAGVNVVFAYGGQVVQVQGQAGGAQPLPVDDRPNATLPRPLDRWLAQLWPSVRSLLNPYFRPQP